jgi:hypothetical protein
MVSSTRRNDGGVQGAMFGLFDVDIVFALTLLLLTAVAVLLPTFNFEIA